MGSYPLLHVGFAAELATDPVAAITASYVLAVRSRISTAPMLYRVGGWLAADALVNSRSLLLGNRSCLLRLCLIASRAPAGSDLHRGDAQLGADGECEADSKQEGQ
jgi:hypothetical protein